MCVGFLDGSAGNEAACSSRDAGDIGNEVQSLGGEDPLEEEMGNCLQYSSLKNPMDRGAWWTIVHRVAKSWT